MRGYSAVSKKPPKAKDAQSPKDLVLYTLEQQANLQGRERSSMGTSGVICYMLRLVKSKMRGTSSEDQRNPTRITALSNTMQALGPRQLREDVRKSGVDGKEGLNNLD